ncbi:MAG: CTP synthase [Candidatus Micrarchaeota archaeon]|nr:CTP synthase [Candidatus Micrarchaeota archaeon]MDE1849242.1 CTP synthase [Candidatus Micrarchaeota archaeon]
MPTKYVVILGSLMSGLGKGVVTSSILRILDFYNCKVIPVKFDGYLNYDCGTMNPYRHGEVFVLDDKSEVDMDFGIYERFLNKSLKGDYSITGGKLFSVLLSKERKGDYLGEDIQIIPHMTDEIIKRMEGIAKREKPDVIVVEVGGTVGDIENSYFIEAMRQLSLDHDVTFINLTYIPSIDVVGEQKTKPAQIGFRLLLQSGIRADYVICRTSNKLLEKTKEKLALFAHLGKDKIIDDSTQESLYNLPLHFMDQGFHKELMKDLGLASRKISQKKVEEWKERVGRILKPSKKVTIGIIGKYTELKDSYASVKEALIHAGSENDARVDIRWIESETLESGDMSKALEGVDGVIVTGGFGKRGTEGMINGIQYAREHGIPFLGICLGMQLMVAEYARNVCGMKDANSTEFDPGTRHNVIDILPSQIGIKDKGGTMRLGAYECVIPSSDSTAYKVYNSHRISERHRHRYEFNNRYRRILSKNGLVLSGFTKDRKLVEFAEWKGSFGIGTQAHPELKSRLQSPAPLFVSLVRSALSAKE